VKRSLNWLRGASLGLAARIGLVLIFAVALSIASSAAFLYFLGPRGSHPTLDEIRPLAQRVVAAYQQLSAASVDRRSALAKALSGPSLVLEWPVAAPHEVQGHQPGFLVELQALVQAELHDPGERVEVDLAPPPGSSSADKMAVPPSFGEPPPAGGFQQREPPIELSLRFNDGSWLAVYAADWMPNRFLLYDLLSRVIPVSLVCILLFIGLVIGFTRPLARLGAAAERLGRDENVPLLTESGAAEMRATARAFNQMQVRLKRLIDDRTQMLAALSHDLKTPLTRLRLRAEFVDDTDLQEMILADLQEMKAIVDSTLAFARGEAQEEPREAMDLADLLQSLAESRADCGAGVRYQGPAHLTVRARPIALRRALNNLLDNAVTYGGSARLRLYQSPAAIAIEVEDDGPGIPEDQLELVFRPYVRLESSRSRETGGVGLGLTIARTVFRSEGGDVKLANLNQKGLRATATLPLTALSSALGRTPADLQL